MLMYFTNIRLYLFALLMISFIGVKAQTKIRLSDLQKGSPNQTLITDENGTLKFQTLSNSLMVNGNVLTSVVNGISSTASVINQNNISVSNGVLTSVVNGVSSTTAINTTTTNQLSATNGVLTSVVNGVSRTTAIITSSGIVSNENVITSSINGISQTTTIVNTNSINISGNTLTSVVNGVSATAFIAVSGSGKGDLQVVTSNTTLTNNIGRINVNGANNDITITLPSDPTIGQEHYITKIDENENYKVIINPNGKQFTNGLATISNSVPYATMLVTYDGNKWFLKYN